MHVKLKQLKHEVLRWRRFTCGRAGGVAGGGRCRAGGVGAFFGASDKLDLLDTENISTRTESRVMFDMKVVQPTTPTG